ncbi:MAG: putative transcriptional regulator (GntR-family) [Acidimicrobiales bacterium]|nr:putative transcriptional regulator (GntR-family) [Acidimicrobiales bacterium]
MRVANVKPRRAQTPASNALLEEIALAVIEPTARGIAGGISRLVSAGHLEAGTRLPTVRVLANRLGVSPTTVSQAWQSLTRAGVLMPQGRSGTFVRGGRVVGAGRTLRTYESPGGLPLDLSTGTPDPELVPDVVAALSRVTGEGVTTSYVDRPVLPAFDELLRANWPFEPEALTVVNGAMDALDRVTTAVVRYGSRVLVENPCFPPLLDLLELVGAEVIGVPLDDEGPVVEAVRAALPLQPVALYLQSRAQNPAGTSLSAVRARELAEVLQASSLVVVEDDHAGEVAGAPLVSLGTYLPTRTVHIRGYSKTYGPDLRLASVGGAGGVIESVDARRLLGPGWTSRLLQAVLVELLTDRAVIAQVAEASSIYAGRRRDFRAMLDARGVRSSGRDGINLWIEVPHEQLALVTLAAAGIGVSPGSSFVTEPLSSDHLRLTVGLLSDAGDKVADALADAVRAGLRSTGFPRR